MKAAKKRFLGNFPSPMDPPLPLNTYRNFFVTFSPKKSQGLQAEKNTLWDVEEAQASPLFKKIS